ncbi:MAG: putative BsuMI modification methylase subunit YdiO [Syntrophomonadaceae bacterium]|nr:putative BsuMI modification methylase subunit YdiO [Bacillota bacterium]MBT9146983.1 putative BsuMI modification methylase subunit YdiO [Bacillota bacterium]
MENPSVVDLFCGAGALTHGFVLEGFDVVAGFDADDSCRYAYEANNDGARFIHKRVGNVTAEEIAALYPEGHLRILIGCAPCQPYSPYTKKKENEDDKWRLVPKFADLTCEVDPDVVSMENVPDLATFRDGAVYRAFVARLKEKGYHVTEYPEVYCPDYGIPQHRTRLVLFASKFGEIEIVAATHSPDRCRTVREAIGYLEPVEAGQTSDKDPLHRASRLSELNLRRIRASVPGGTWRDWDEELVAGCHKKESGRGYASVYGRMQWDEPSPTITAQCYGFGNGRFGHPEQDRAISLREAALLQTFPEDYQFVPPEAPHYITVIGRLIGNAVPVDLGRVIAKSIKRHLESHVD